VAAVLAMRQALQYHAWPCGERVPAVAVVGNPALANNLPAELSAFIGRDREVAEVRAWWSLAAWSL